MSRAQALVAVHAAVLLFGFAGLFGKWLAFSPLVIVLGRTVVAAAALGLMLVIRPGARAGFDARLIVNGAVLALHWGSFFAAIQVATVAVGLLGFASFPLFVLLQERVLLGRRWSRAEAATALAVAAGLALLVPEFSFGNRTVQGLAWGVVSGFTFALLAVHNRRLAPGRSAVDLAFWQNLLAAMCLVPVVALAAPGSLVLDGRDLALLLVLGLVCTALAHTVFIASLAVVSAHTASVIAALEPVYGIALAVVLLGEVPGLRTLAGGALIVGAVVVASHRAARQVSSRPAIR
jgi:drug/metabolite transporter (DMT)-like permease